MKKTVLFASTLFCLSTIAQAQITKGAILLGGSVGIVKGKTENNDVEMKSTSTYISPSLGVAIKDNWVLGLRAGYSTDSYDQESSPYKNDMDGYSAGAFVRRYLPLSNHFYLYGQGDLGYYSEKRKQISGTDNINNIESKGYNLSLTPGITYAVSKRFHLEAYLNNLVSLGYSNNKTESIGLAGVHTTSAKSFSFNTNLGSSVPLNVGFRILLGK